MDEDKAVVKRVRLFRNLAFALLNGFVMFFYSERLFWTIYRSEDSIQDHIITWIFYSAVTFVFLWAVRHFRVRTLWALFVAGAFYGWIVEGVLAWTLYGTEPSAPFPLSISVTGLSWHALITVMVGWYYVRRTLLQNNLAKTAMVAGLIGLYWGAWAMFLWRENPPVIKPIHEFFLYALVMTSLLILSYWVIDRCNPTRFTPGKFGLGFCAFVLLGFFILQNVVNLGLRPLLILTPLLLIIYFTLRKNRKEETRPDLLAALEGNVKLVNYLMLLAMPIIATAFYRLALAANLGRFPVNVAIYYYITAPAGIVMLILSLLQTFRQGLSRNISQEE